MNNENNLEKLTKEEIAVLVESGGLFDMLQVIDEIYPRGANKMKRNLINGFIEEYAPRTDLQKEELANYLMYIIERTQKNLERINKKTRGKRKNRNKEEKDKDEK